MAEDIFDRIEKATRTIQRRNLSRAQQEALIRKIARDAVEASTRRRAEAARRIAAAYPHRPGLLSQIAAWLTNMARAVVEALVAFVNGFKAGFRDGEAGIASNERRKEFVRYARETGRQSRARDGLDALLDRQDVA